ncbi:MAG: hypothetical protein KatS3mg002_0853 [Candidatus Woesearchaeota archaeon]|nr:MAG: hypothetical protein KatS3mg002_0853 [Candidatus Woesearchaeota archaeon]
MRGSKEKLQKLIEERDAFLKYVNRLNSQVSSGELTSRERNFLLELRTKGVPANEYLDRLDSQIIHTSRYDETKPKIVRHASIVAAIILILALGYFFNSTLTGLIGYSPTQNYVINVDKNYTTGVIDYYFNVSALGNNTSNITSIRVSGEYIGDFKIKLISKDIEYIIYESEDTQSDNLITGYAIKRAKEIINIPESEPEIENNNTINEITPKNKIENQTPVKDEIIIEKGIGQELTESTTENATEDIDYTGIISEEKEKKSYEEKSFENPIEKSENSININETNYTTEYTLKKFNQKCKETCNIEIEPKDLIIKIEVNGTLYLEKIVYAQKTTNQPPVQLKNISAMKSGDIIKLSEYFIDPEGEKLYYDIPFNEDVEAIIEEDTLKITSVKKNTSLFIYVTDGEKIITSNNFNILLNTSIINIPNEILEIIRKEGSARVLVKTKLKTQLLSKESNVIKTAANSGKIEGKKVLMLKSKKPIEGKERNWRRKGSDSK